MRDRGYSIIMCVLCNTHVASNWIFMHDIRSCLHIGVALYGILRFSQAIYTCSTRIELIWNAMHDLKVFWQIKADFLCLYLSKLLKICTDFFFFFLNKFSYDYIASRRLIFSDIHQRGSRFLLKCTKPLNLIQFSKYKNKICVYHRFCVWWMYMQEGYFRTTNLPTKINFFFVPT